MNSAELADHPRHFRGSALTADTTLDADVVIVGTGAGGGVAAEILAAAGLDVVMLEHGPLKTRRDFRMRERDAYPSLYWYGGARKTADLAINMMQGRCVGGSTTVNWTTCFRTPEPTLATWAEQHAVRGCSPAELAPWFQRMETRLGIHPWPQRPNENNNILARGAAALGWHHAGIARNVQRCANSGYCGLGCPVDAKQSMLVTTVPAAMASGARLYSEMQAQRLVWQGDRIDHLRCSAQDARINGPTGITLKVRARHYLVCGGAINSPALLLRSELPDPHRRLGKRSFLHPVVSTLAVMPEPVNPFHGAPQSLYSDEFLWPERGLGYKIEVAPLQPALLAGVHNMHGEQHQALMQRLDHVNAMVVILRDGFHARSPGGSVQLGADGLGVLDYPLNDYLWDGVRRAMKSMAECQFAAGAESVHLGHVDARPVWNWRRAREEIDALPMQALRCNLASAHLMGGCAMGEDPRHAVVNSLGQHHQVENLSIMDGSIFPTSIGANPSLSIYANTARQASALAAQLTAA